MVTPARWPLAARYRIAVTLSASLTETLNSAGMLKLQIAADGDRRADSPSATSLFLTFRRTTDGGAIENLAPRWLTAQSLRRAPRHHAGNSPAASRRAPDHSRP